MSPKERGYQRLVIGRDFHTSMRSSWKFWGTTVLPHLVSTSRTKWILGSFGVTFVTGLPHSVAMDDIYNGMLIPKGSMICVNLWCVCGIVMLRNDQLWHIPRLIFHDPEIFVDPHAFRPARFLGDEGTRCRDVLNLVWGLGRRYIDCELLLILLSNGRCLPLDRALVDNLRKQHCS